MAQTANLGAALGRTVTVTPNSVPVQGTTVQVVSPTMTQIQARHADYQARLARQAAIVADANAAARAAAVTAGNSVPNGLVAGGLDPVVNAVRSQVSLTGLDVWQGADRPTQSQSGTLIDVSVRQTESRALLSWNSFNIGSDTRLTFDQQGNKDWVVVNRVVGGIDASTGLLNPALGPTPTQILGQIRADGTVYILNRSGVLFGATSQINLNSLVASSLELGSNSVPFGTNSTRQTTLVERNNSFLLNGILPSSQSGLLANVMQEVHGAVSLAAGGRINSTGGFVILSGPTVSSAGEIRTTAGGQVNLAAGQQIDAIVSTGAADSIDPNVRGLVLATLGGGTVNMTGSIDTPQGYVSLTTDQTGSVNVGGIITSTTGVSRNGKVSLIGGSVTIAPEAVLSIRPDSAADTIPQSPASLNAFKTSQIDIGAQSSLRDPGTGRIVPQVGAIDGLAASLADLLPTNVTIGTGALVQATGGEVNIGGRADGPDYVVGRDNGVRATQVQIQGTAAIDVSGVADHLIDASRNQLVVAPAKRNELRDTPNYRETPTDGSFTLNGATLYLDPRLSGIRSDGVAWIGSPLVEAKSLFEQTGVTVSELLTKGGNITLKTAGVNGLAGLGALPPSISLSDTAVLDFSGGWVRYREGFIRTTQLITADGRVVDIGSADPNENFVGIANGFVEQLPQAGSPTIYGNGLLANARFEGSYIEGRDAGTLNLIAPSATLGAALHGDAVAGARQISDAQEATGKSGLSGDLRRVQASRGQLPAGGMFRFAVPASAQSAVLGGDVRVGGANASLPEGTTFLSDTALTAAGLSGLSIQTSGRVEFAQGSSVSLNAGGALNVDAGRKVSFGGSIDAAGGSITAQTHLIIGGSLFTTADDLGNLAGSPAPGDFDVVVSSGAQLSTRGRWVNDFLVTDGLYGGAAYTGGGSISLTSAPYVLGFADETQSRALDFSGSIRIAAGSLLDVSGGGFVSRTGALSLDGQGGNVSLINNTVYFQLHAISALDFGNLQGDTLFRTDLTRFQLVPSPSQAGSSNPVGYSSAILPDAPLSVVDLAAGTIRGFGFEGGGTFKLVTPDLSFGSSGGTGTAIGLDFLEQTGFATLDLTAWNSSFLPNVFNNGRTGITALLSTERVQINAGETLNLTQSILPSLLTLDQINQVRTLTSGTDVSRNALFTPTNDLGDFYNLAANLVVGGLSELQVLGGTITGAPGATITAPKLLNDGTISIHGGSITQSLFLPESYLSGRESIALRPIFNAQGVDRGAALSAVFGTPDANGLYDELALNNAGFKDSLGNLLSNRDIVSGGNLNLTGNRQIYYLGDLDADEGLRFTSRSVTDLSGISIRDPRAPVGADGSPIALGRLVSGGSISALGRRTGSETLFGDPALADRFYATTEAEVIRVRSIRPALELNALAGATIDLSGASDSYDILTGPAQRTSTAVWSDGGTLSARGGGTIDGALITAQGGSARALGGTLEWLNPVLRDGAAVAGIPSLSTDAIEAAGFDRFIGRGLLGTLGNATLNLGYSFQMRSPDYLGTSTGLDGGYYSVGVTGTGNLTIAAPFIRFESFNQTPGALPATPVGGAGGFNASFSGSAIDIAGGLSFGLPFETVTLSATGDIRLIGVRPAALVFNPGSSVEPSLSGGLYAGGDLTLRAARTYATTGTGNLQKAIENPSAAPAPFLIASFGGGLQAGQTIGKDGATIRFERTSNTPVATPLSAGSWISVLAENIVQAGALFAPLGRIDLGSRERVVAQAAGGTPYLQSTDSVVLPDGGLTSVSANGLTIPYGTTTDLTETYFTPGVTSALTAPPTGELRLGGQIITTGETATVDARGGGTLRAYEFVSGTNGSRDVLSRFNVDPFSSSNGFQYADGRQVYAIVPVSAAEAASLALSDPIFGAGYDPLFGSQMGRTVQLDAAPGIAAGEYLLLPAQYAAVIPGAMRLVENTQDVAPILGASAVQRDGSVVVGGVYGIAGIDRQESLRRSFTLQSQAVLRKYSRIELSNPSTRLSELAVRNGTIVPRLPNDAARIVIDPGTGLSIGSSFNTAVETGGRGSQVDILGSIISVLSPGSAAPAEGLGLTTDTLANLNAASLLIGASRTDRADGSTLLNITAERITVANDAANPLTAPEIVLAVRGENAVLDVRDGASIVASGTLVDQRSGAYDVTVRDVNTPQRQQTSGSVLRLANGVDRSVSNVGLALLSGARDRSDLIVGAATLSGTSLLLNASNVATLGLPSLDVDRLALSSDTISFSERTFGVQGTIISPELEAVFASIGSVSLRSEDAIAFTPGTHSFNDLTIDAPGIRLLRPVAGGSRDPMDVLIVASDVVLSNSFADRGSCTSSGPLSCNATGNSLSIVSDTLTIGSGTFRTSYGADGAVNLTAANGMRYTGAGTLDFGTAALTLNTPFIIDQGAGVRPDVNRQAVSLNILTTGTVTIAGPAGSAPILPTLPLAPGARLAFGAPDAAVASFTVSNAALRSTAGRIAVNSQSDVLVEGTARLLAQGYSQNFGDAADQVTVSAGGGAVALTAATGDIRLAADARINIGAASGKSGSVSLAANRGGIDLGAGILTNIVASAPDGGGSLRFEARDTAFDLDALIAGAGSTFTGDLAVRTATGDLSLSSGRLLRATSVSLTADGGSLTVGGTINTSGINGGAVSLFARDRVALTGTARIDTHADGYAVTDTRRAEGGDVMIGVGTNGGITVASGATLDLGARRIGDRLVAHQQIDSRTRTPITAYSFVEADSGGALTLRAPVIDQAGLDAVDIGFNGSVTGADRVTVEGYRSFALNDMATDARFTGVTITNGTASLDTGATRAGAVNFLSDAGASTGTVTNFVQNFAIDTSRLSALTALGDAFHSRAGVQLDYDGNIVLASNWNLGAGVVDVQAAVADGLMQESVLGPDSLGNPRYEVLPGREADLFRGYVTMLYRTGGRVDGEAGALTLRAGGDLRIEHSITDGFFAFSDQTDPDYLSYQLGGGKRFYRPALNVRCGASGCENLADYAPDTTGNRPQLPVQRTSINVNLSQVTGGEQLFPLAAAPYSALANAADARGLGVNGAGDPIGSAELFPLLGDGSAVESFDFRLVGGAGETQSANMLQVDVASGGNVVVTGEVRYDLDSVRPTGAYTGALQLEYDPTNAPLADDDLLAAFAIAGGVSQQKLITASTRVTFGNASPAAVAFMRSEAQRFFAGDPNVQFVGPANGQPTGFAVPFARFVAFLNSTDESGQTLRQRFGALVANGSLGYNAPATPGTTANPTGEAIARTLVRTGIGSIDVAAAADIDLRNGEDPVLLTRNNTRAGNVREQAGGAAIYTAGHRVNPFAVTALVAGTQTALTIDPTAYAITTDARSPLWLPQVNGRLQVNPVYATGGGSISLTAGDDVLGRRDLWSEAAFNRNDPATTSIKGYEAQVAGTAFVGAADQRWRVGLMGIDRPSLTSQQTPTVLATNIRINAQQFSSGVGTLGGGDVRIVTGGDLSELTVALDTSVTTGDVGSSFGSMVFGGGDLTANIGGDLRGGRFHISTGLADMTVGGDVAQSDSLAERSPSAALTEIRLTDARVSVRANGSVSLGAVAALGVDSNDQDVPLIDPNAAGYYTGNSALVVRAGSTVSLGDNPGLFATRQSQQFVNVRPATLDIATFAGDIALSATRAEILYPGARGQLSLLAGGTLRATAIDLSDADASLLPGIFSAVQYDVPGVAPLFGRLFELSSILPYTSDQDRRATHNQYLMRAGDTTPARIAVGGSLSDLTLYSGKQMRISAVDDIINMVFVGQNMNADDTTRIVAGRDILGTTSLAGPSSGIANRLVVEGNLFLIGGGGTFAIEAGRDLGPFLNSATIANDGSRGLPGRGVSSFGGGILAIGNDFNPWLAPKSADIQAFFGVAKGINFEGLREAYLNPANIDDLDGDLFEQVEDAFGNKSPDRTRPIYGPILIQWMQARQAGALIAAFGTTNVTSEQAYAVFAALPTFTQRRFLLDNVYFNELSAPSRPDGPSYLQYVRGYRAVDTLFPSALGYTANDLSGDSNGGTRVATGNLDLRLATIGTNRDSAITILGPGGNAILGSVIRTSAQAAARGYDPTLLGSLPTQVGRSASPTGVQIAGIPLGFEGVLTLRGGKINSFTDGDLRLNQSRLFAQQGGDLVLWSSNGDLNAGQGPKSAADVPPIVLRFNPNGGSEVDAASGVVGAGIAGFAGIRRRNPVTGVFEYTDAQNDPDAAAALARLAELGADNPDQVVIDGKSFGTVTINGKTYLREVPSITLVAPAGTVDAGDAGVRASGDIFVAAAQVTNADNFKVGGQSVGVPSLAAPAAPALPANAAAAVTANVFRANDAGSGDQRSRISVDVLGVYSATPAEADPCIDAEGNPIENCPEPVN